MDATKAEVINQIRELNALLIQAKLHVGRSKLAHHFHRDELDSDMPGLHGQGRLLGILGLNPGTSETTPRDLGYILGKYDLWSRFEPETQGVMIAYASVYGNTENAANILACRLV